VKQHPLSALLSFVFVAFTIAVDNEFEHRAPHRTTVSGGTPRDGPWLASMAMWLNCMRLVPDDGIDARELTERARTPTNLNGMIRWGYVRVEDGTVYPTTKGRRARAVWAPLAPLIEERWRERFGEDRIDALVAATATIVNRLDVDLPDCLPILGYGLYGKFTVRKRSPNEATDRPANAETGLVSSLAKLLLLYAISFEREAPISLPMSANVLRLITKAGTSARDIPRAAGIAKDAVRNALGFLTKKGYVTIAERGTARIVTLTENGVRARQTYDDLVFAIEDDLRSRFGATAIDELRGALEAIALDADAGVSPLLAAIEPYPDGWRASRPQPVTLPHYPMVLHRGGFPEGS
jgi:predicted transcriptional regulator